MVTLIGEQPEEVMDRSVEPEVIASPSRAGDLPAGG
jgi:transcription termination factor Rho